MHPFIDDVEPWATIFVALHKGNSRVMVDVQIRLRYARAFLCLREFENRVVGWFGNIMIRSIGILILAFSVLPAVAQMSVTTFGATDAQDCYHDASDGFSTDTASCDTALRDGNLTRRDHNKTLVNRGIILNRAGDYRQALEDFNKALARNPDLAEALLNRGNTHFLMRNINAAISDYEASLEKGIKKRHVAWYNIGLAYDALKAPEKALAAYEKALELNPEFGLAQKKLARRN